MMVVSMFDGYSSGLQALKDMNIPVSEYHAFEIDPYAIKVSEKNHPEIIRHGDVNDWHKADIDWMNVDLILAGSPCQGFSFAGKQLAFDSDVSGRREIWIVDSDGQNPRQVTSLEALSNFPSWSPDGSQI